MNLSINSPQVQAVSAALHRVCADADNATLWLALDGSSQARPEIEGVDWTQREAQTVRLPHPQIDPQWWPQWHALHLDRAPDCDILNHSIGWALAEADLTPLRAGQGRRVSGWFLTNDCSVRQAARHWGQAMVRRQQHAGGQMVLLRLHDPAVLWAVWQLLTSAV